MYISEINLDTVITADNLIAIGIEPRTLRQAWNDLDVVLRGVTSGTDAHGILDLASEGAGRVGRDSLSIGQVIALYEIRRVEEVEKAYYAELDVLHADEALVGEPYRAAARKVQSRRNARIGALTHQLGRQPYDL